MIIIDGRETEFHLILEKIEEGRTLTIDEERTVELIKKENPDCLAYTSLRNKSGVNFLFFEKGFKKLSIRQVRLRLGNLKGKISSQIKKNEITILYDYKVLTELINLHTILL